MNSRDTRTPTGIVIANDVDPKRILTLKNRYKRSGYPNLLITCSRAEDLEQAIGKNVFDRIVAYVPCSGDGTHSESNHIFGDCLDPEWCWNYTLFNYKLQNLVSKC